MTLVDKAVPGSLVWVKGKFYFTSKDNIVKNKNGWNEVIRKEEILFGETGWATEIGGGALRIRCQWIKSSM